MFKVRTTAKKNFVIEMFILNPIHKEIGLFTLCIVLLSAVLLQLPLRRNENQLI